MVGLFRSEERRNDKFNDLKTSYGGVFKGDKLKKLLFCLTDFIHINDITTEDGGSKTGTELLNILSETGQISTGNIKLLSEIAQLTQFSDAKRAIREYSSKMKFTSYQMLTPYRRRLFEALHGTDQNDKREVMSHYQLDNFDNIWDVVLHLEKHELLIRDNVPRIKRFAGLLNASAKGKLLTYVTSLSTNPQQSQSSVDVEGATASTSFQTEPLGQYKTEPRHQPPNQEAERVECICDRCCSQSCMECFTDFQRLWIANIVSLVCAIVFVAFVALAVYIKEGIFPNVMIAVCSVLIVIPGTVYWCQHNHKWYNKREDDRAKRSQLEGAINLTATL